MNPYIAVAQCLVSLLIAYLIWVIVARKSFQTDFLIAVREIKDALFLFMIRNSYSLDDPEHRKTVEILESFEYACQDGLLSADVTLYLFYVARQDLAWIQRQDTSVKEEQAMAPVPVQQACDEAKSHCMKALGRLVFFRSLGGLLAFCIISLMCWGRKRREDRSGSRSERQLGLRCWNIPFPAYSSFYSHQKGQAGNNSQVASAS